MYEHLDQSATQWSILLANPVKSDSIYKNIVQIMGYCAKSMQKICCQEGGGDKIVSWGGNQKILDRGDMPWLGGKGCTPWWVWSPNPHTPWYWTALVKFINRQSNIWPGGGWSSKFQIMSCCAVFSTGTNQWGGRGGVIIGKYFYSLFTCFWVYRSFLSNKSFLQEKTGNILVGGYPPPPYW